MGLSYTHLVLVALGGAAGGLCRHWLSTFVDHRFGDAFPWGTLTVNVSGALVLGLLAAVFARQDLGGAGDAWLLLAIGLLGSYTTVSSFSAQTLALLHDGRLMSAAANVVLSLALCLAAVLLGYVAGARLAGA